MNIIFLDIDGVLNNLSTDKYTRSKSSFQEYLGIDKDKVMRLADIVKSTDAKLVLTSVSWKEGWECGRQYDATAYPQAKYLDNHLKKKGNLVIYDKTQNTRSIDKEQGILNWLKENKPINKWIILDNGTNLKNTINHLVEIKSGTGLTDEDVKTAIKMLK